MLATKSSVLDPSSFSQNLLTRGRAGRWHNCFSSIQWHNSVTKMFDDFFFDIFLIFGNFDFFRKIPRFFSTKLFTHLQNAPRVTPRPLIS